MSRMRVHEVSSPISLFPFIGILLCTMGALLVVLVAVSRSARSTAQRQVQAQREATTAKANTSDVQKKLDQVNHFVGALGTLRGQAEKKLRDEQARLSAVEDHIRRLHERMESIKSAAVELQALEQEHYDDRQQGEREVERLKQLVAESEKTVASFREAGNKAAHSYAVVPYDGPNGTFRRPIYIECVKNELVIHPEGTRIKVEDLRPPFGPGNPLASVLRATRDQIVRATSQGAVGRDAEPYPLLLVRPDGLLVYDRARSAIEAGDFDLGFELVESDWKIKFPQADPQLAGIQQQALEQARARQQLIAEAAPRAYASVAASDGEDSGFDEEESSDGGDRYGGAGGSGPGRIGAGAGGSGDVPRTYVVHNDKHADKEHGSGGPGGGEGGADNDANGSGTV